jgi:hypothetical protein
MYLKNGEQFDQEKWATAIWTPSVGWLVKALYTRIRHRRDISKQPTVIFCWGQDQYLIRGVSQEWVTSIGGVPESVRKTM